MHCLGQTRTLLDTLFKDKKDANHILSSGTSLYRPYKGVPPPPSPGLNAGLNQILSKVLLCKNMHLEHTKYCLLRDTIMITESTTLSNTWDGKMQKQQILILR